MSHGAGGPVVGIVGFTRVLAAAGLCITPDGSKAFAAALLHVDLAAIDEVYWAGRTTLCRGPDDIAVFDVGFQTWFGGPIPAAGRPYVRRSRRLGLAVSEDPGRDDSGGVSAPLRAAADDTEVLRRRDIAELTASEQMRLAQLIAVLLPRAPSRRALRRKPFRRGSVDVRRSVRDILTAGGEFMPLRHQRRARKPRRVVLLIDVSGSMSHYSDALLRFAHVIVRRHPATTEVFTLGTRLTRLSRALRHRDADVAMAAVSRAVPDWDGGTRLGDTLRVFLQRWGRRGLARGAVMVIFSDGWEGGDPAELATQMGHLRRLAHTILWANPHAGAVGYAPIQSGIAAALPFVDRLIAGHSLAALQDILFEIQRA